MKADFRRPELMELLEAMGQFFEGFGLRRNLGRVWGVLYLSGERVDQAELSEVLGLSAGMISSSLKELEHWGAVQQVLVRGERKMFYEAEARLLRIIATILTKRELHAVRALREAMARAYAAKGERALSRKMKERVRAIELVTDLYEVLTELVVRTSQVSSTMVRRMVSLMKSARFWKWLEPTES